MAVETRAKLLIVDDRAENLFALKNIIDNPDRLIFPAGSGEEALALLLEHEFALAIIDAMMPDINGFELAELMRSTERTRHIPIIFVSAGGRELNYAFKGYETGAVDFLHKPLDVAALKSKVSVFVALHQQRYEIKQKVTELEKSQRQLHAAQAELQRALAMRDEFMSLVSHELRTPLNTLHMESQIRQLQLNKNDMNPFTREKLEAMVARDSRQIQSMIRLIGDMTDVSRIQNGQLSIRRTSVDLSQLLHQVIADLSAQAEAAGCSLVPDIADSVCGHWDQLRVEQIITNLLTNALRYGNSKPISIQLQSQVENVEITVRDQGIGIDPAAQERIFEKFERADSKRVKDGLGMGLYIARQLAEAHQGTLQVESVLGEGASFCLRLPR